MPWINGKFWYTRDKIVTSEQSFYSMPALDPSAIDILVVNPTTYEVGTQSIASLVGSSGGGNNMWYESWHMTTEGIDASLNYANSGKKVFYHGFIADTTGEYTNMKVRIENTSGTAIGLTMKVAIYDSTNSGTLIDSSPHPTVLQGEGETTFSLTPSDYGTHSYLDIPFNSPISVTRGNIYFVALFYNDGIDGLFGLGHNNTSSGNYRLSYSSVSTTVSSFVSTIPSGSGSLEPNPQAAYWFTLYGLQSAAGAIQGPPGPAGPSTVSVSFYADYGSKTNNPYPPPTSVSAPKLMAFNNTDVTNGQNSTGMKGYPIFPHGAGGHASATGFAYSGLSNANFSEKPMIYGSYMHRSGRIVGVGTNVHYEDAGNTNTPNKIEPYVVVYGGAGGSASESKVGGWIYDYGGSTTTAPTNGNPPERGHYGSANRLATGLTFKAGDYIGIYVPEDNSLPSTTAPFFSVEGTLYLVFD